MCASRRPAVGSSDWLDDGVSTHACALISDPNQDEITHELNRSNAPMLCGPTPGQNKRNREQQPSNDHSRNCPMRIMGIRCSRRDDKSERGEKANQLRDSERGSFHLTRSGRRNYVFFYGVSPSNPLAFEAAARVRRSHA